MGVKYCRPIRLLENSVIYVPPHGIQSIWFMTLTDSIENAELLVTLCLTLCSCKCRKVRESAGNGEKNRGNGEKRWERARNGEKRREAARNGQKFWHEIAGSVIFVGPIWLSMHAFHTSYTKFSFSSTIENHLLHPMICFQPSWGLNADSRQWAH